MRDGVDQWFVREVFPLEGMLTRFLHTRRVAAAEIPDFIQETYMRVYQAALITLPAEPRALLLTTARNLVIDQVRRKRVVDIESVAAPEELEVLVDELSPERQASAREELLAMALAIDELSEKGRSVLWLRRVEGLSQKETAAQMNLNEDAVESQLARALRSLSRALFGTSPPGRGRST